MGARRLPADQERDIRDMLGILINVRQILTACRIHMVDWPFVMLAIRVGYEIEPAPHGRPGLRFTRRTPLVPDDRVRL